MARHGDGTHRGTFGEGVGWLAACIAHPVAQRSKATSDAVVTAPRLTAMHRELHYGNVGADLAIF